MSMVQKIFQVFVCGIVLISFSSCGSATNNDQGTSFLALGFFADGSGTDGDVGTLVALNVDSVAQLPNQPSNPLFVPNNVSTSGGIQGGFIGIENRMTSQFIRTIGADCSYTVSGADPGLEIPSDATYFTTVLQPGTSSTSSGGSSSGSTAYIQMPIVSPDVITFLSVNQNYLPQLPFRMQAECTVTGITQAGDTMVTNPVNYEMIFYQLEECCTAGTNDPGFQNGGGTGGDFTGTTSTGTTSSSSSSSSSG